MATSDILAIVNKYPDIGTANANYVGELIELAKESAVAIRGLPYWPEADAAGYSEGAASGSINISALTEESLLIRIDGSDQIRITGIVLASCTTGSATATEVQRAIRAELNSDSAGYRSFISAAVVYADTKYTITSPSFGEESSVVVEADDKYFRVAEAMKLGRTYGGKEYAGVWNDSALERAVAELTAAVYRAYRMLPEMYKERPDEALIRAAEKIDELAVRLIKSGKRWRYS